MKPITPYLFFNGKCREALDFYKSIFGGDLTIVTYADGQNPNCPANSQDRIMHGALRSGGLTIMASDTPTADEPPIEGNQVQLSLDCGSLSEIESQFKTLSEKGSVIVALHDAPWGARFGMLEDRYGFQWMLSFDRAKG